MCHQSSEVWPGRKIGPAWVVLSSWWPQLALGGPPPPGGGLGGLRLPLASGRGSHLSSPTSAYTMQHQSLQALPCAVVQEEIWGQIFIGVGNPVAGYKLQWG